MVNRTMAYLGMVKYLWPTTLSQAFEKIEFLLDAIYYRDLIYEKFETNPKHIFFIYNVNKTNKKGQIHTDFLKLLKQVRKDKRYVADYPVRTYEKHCVVFSLSEFPDLWDNFHLGRYSKMYSPDQVKKMGNIGHLKRSIFNPELANEETFNHLVLMVESAYKVKNLEFNGKIIEYDIPPQKNDIWKL
jgi:hypothetical protein